MSESEQKIMNPGRKLFFGLFIFPLIIAVGMTVLLCAVVLMTSEKETPESLVGAIKSGSPSKRWQKAFELSNELNQKNASGIRDSALRTEIIYIATDSRDYDAKTRSYMAMALGRFSGPEPVAALRSLLKEDSPEIQIASMWSLGSMNAREAAPDVEIFLKSDQPELRKTAVYIMGVLGAKETAVKLKPLLNDASADVRWNAALALARLGDDSGFPVLKEMVNRSIYEPLGMDETQIEPVMINAIRGLALIQKPESIKILESLAGGDKNMKVRQAAIDAVNYRKNN